MAAKHALLGEDVVIINCEKAIVSGEKQQVLARYRQRYARGTHSTGPFILRNPDRIVRRTVRGMLPYKLPRGAAAYKKVMTYVGVPAEYEGKETTSVDAKKSKLPNTKYVTVGDISKNLGGSQ